MLLAAGLLSCAEAAGPAIIRLDFAPHADPRVPLAAMLTCATDVESLARVQLDDGQRVTTIAGPPAPATSHEILLLGVRPGAPYRLTLEVEDDEGRVTTSAPWDWTTPPLPAGFPPLEVTVRRPARSEPGVTLIPCQPWLPTGQPDRQRTVLVALDGSGEVVWCFDAPYAIASATGTSDGHLLLLSGTLGDALVIDWLGRVVRRWATTGGARERPAGAMPVDAGTLHHELVELPSGHLLSLSTETREFASYPASETDPTVPRAPATVIGDVVLEFAPDGAVVGRWPLLDLLDPFRIGYDSLDGRFWQEHHPGTDARPARDWSHANSVFHDASDDTFIVSACHQDAIFKFRRDTGELLWILGFPTGWDQGWRERLLSPLGDGTYPFHQHAARLTRDRTLLLFDNGKYGALPFLPRLPPEACRSRVVEFAIDEAGGTFRQLWSYGEGPGEAFYSAFLGEVDELPTSGNLLITDGGRVRRPDGGPGEHPSAGRTWARVLEVTRDTPAEVVFEVLLDDPRQGWSVYRSERLAGLGPP